MSVDASDSQLSSFPRSYGPYLLLKRVGRGGMGEVLLAKHSTLTGIDKLIVVKKLLATNAVDHDYVTRFVDEARTVVLLTHRNICQVFDVGSVDGSYYLAMEHVRGRDLRAVLERVVAQNASVSTGIALHIAGEMLEALDYAHRLADPSTDAPLGIVHRDVSPQNVLVNFEGEVKVIDFGLASSTMKSSQTNPGIVLGKLAYMSPEQARGDVVDRRSDVFSTGIVLYELLTGHRFYGEKRHDEIYSVVGVGGFEPPLLSTLRPELRSLIARATAGHVDKRFASCGAFLDAMHDAEEALRVRVSSADVRAFMHELFPGEDAADRKSTASLVAASPSVERAAREDTVRIAVAPAFIAETSTLTALPAPTTTAPQPRAAPSKLVAPLVAALAVAVVALVVVLVAERIGSAPSTSASVSAGARDAELQPSPVATAAPGQRGADERPSAPTSPGTGREASSSTTGANSSSTTGADLSSTPGADAPSRTGADATSPAARPSPSAPHASHVRTAAHGSATPSPSAPASTSSASASAAPSTREPLPPTPPLLADRVKVLAQRCRARVACAAPLVASYARWASMEETEARALRANVAACIEECRAAQ